MSLTNRARSRTSSSSWWTTKVSGMLGTTAPRSKRRLWTGWRRRESNWRTTTCSHFAARPGVSWWPAGTVRFLWSSNSLASSYSRNPGSLPCICQCVFRTSRKAGSPWGYRNTVVASISTIPISVGQNCLINYDKNVFLLLSYETVPAACLIRCLLISGLVLLIILLSVTTKDAICQDLSDSDVW